MLSWPPRVAAHVEEKLVALTAQDVARLADLARIELSEEELARLAPQLDVILTAVASVAEVAEQDVAPTSNIA